MLNKACLIGHLGADPEIRSVASGDRVANLRMATSDRWKDKASGEQKERTEWHRIVVWGALVDVIEKYVHKGSKLYIEGKLQTRKWKDAGGVDHYSTEIVLQGFGNVLEMLDGKPQGDQGGGDRNQSRHQWPAEETQAYGGGREDFSADLDDEIPF